MSRSMFLLVTVLVAVACAERETSNSGSGRVIPLPLPGFPTIPLPFALPPFPGLGFLGPQPRFGKPGLCPFVSRLVPPAIGPSASVCGNLCTEDSICPLGQKCCPHECGYSCFNPVILARTNQN